MTLKFCYPPSLTSTLIFLNDILVSVPLREMSSIWTDLNGPLWPSGVVSLTCLLTLTLALAWSRCPVLYPLPLSLLAPLLRLLLVGLPFPCPAFLMSPANAGSDDDHSPICSPFWFTIRPFKFCNVQKQKVMETDDVHSQKAFR